MVECLIAEPGSFPGARWKMKVLPSSCKRLDLRAVGMIKYDGDPVSSRWRKNNVLYLSFRAKYIDTQLRCVTPYGKQQKRFSFSV